VTSFVIHDHEMDLITSVQYDFLVNMAAFDTAIAIWREKYRYNSVRPFSAIAYLHKYSNVTAWGGPGKGTVTKMPANHWMSYLPVADHPEYPSGSAGFCAAFAEASRLYFKSDQLGWEVDVRKGSSSIEPGMAPKTNLHLLFPTWTEFERTCGLSRVWGGVHFSASLSAGRDIGRKVAAGAFAYFQNRVNPK
jgi:hypothetical protein